MSLVKLINSLLIVLLLFVLWKLLLSLFMSEPILDTQRKASAASHLASGQWQWFQNSDALNNTQKLDRAALNAKVLGVVMKGDQSVALISLPGRPQKVYRIGDKINNRTSLEAVDATRIILRENGVLRELELEKLGSANTSNVAIVSRSETQPNEQALALLDMARAVPVSVEGGTGLRLDDLSDEIQQLSELQSGDIVLSVEGQDVMSLQTDNNWQSLMNKTDAQVDLIRAGQAMTIQVNVATLAQQMLQSLTN